MREKQRILNEMQNKKTIDSGARKEKQYVPFFIVVEIIQHGTNV